jgi:hypothetical protein
LSVAIRLSVNGASAAAIENIAAREPFSHAEGVNPDSSGLEVTGDDTLGDVSDEEKGLQEHLFLLEHFTE